MTDEKQRVMDLDDVQFAALEGVSRSYDAARQQVAQAQQSLAGMAERRAKVFAGLGLDPDTDYVIGTDEETTKAGAAATVFVVQEPPAANRVERRAAGKPRAR